MKYLLKNIIAAILQFEARLVIKRYKPKIVAVTGSVGKTTTKDAIYAVLSSRYYVRKSEKSFNSEIGVPLAILGLPNAWSRPLMWLLNFWRGFAIIFSNKRYPQWLVLEVGADRPGDIHRITRWLKPDITVVTRLAKVPAHIEFFKSVEQLIEEKAALASALKPDGTLLVNGDDEDALRIARKTDRAAIAYGFSSHASVKATYPRIVYRKLGGVNVPAGITFKIDTNGSHIPITVHGVLGSQHIYPALAAVTAGSLAGINMVTMSEALSAYEPPRGRMGLVEGVKQSMIIDDTYNSSPIALAEALLTLKAVKTRKRRIAVIGDMLEIGEYTSGEHKNAGYMAADICDVLITVGVRARYAAEGALAGGLSETCIFQYEDAKNAGDKLQHILDRGDIALVKGSQGMRMERVVEEVMAHPELKRKLLVRQEAEWLRKK